MYVNTNCGLGVKLYLLTTILVNRGFVFGMLYISNPLKLASSHTILLILTVLTRKEEDCEKFLAACVGGRFDLFEASLLITAVNRSKIAIKVLG